MEPEIIPPALPLRTLAEAEADHIVTVLRACAFQQRAAARALGISRWSLARRLRKHKIAIQSPQGKEVS